MKDTYSAYPIRAHAYLMPLTQSPGFWLLTGVEVGHESRGLGVARDLMKRVLFDADNERATICLSIEPDGTGLDYEQLKAWYTRLGFVEEPDSWTGMVRQPQEGDS